MLFILISGLSVSQWLSSHDLTRCACGVCQLTVVVSGTWAMNVIYDSLTAKTVFSVFVLHLSGQALNGRDYRLLFKLIKVLKIK